jgi:crossover junction endodeoxyribonuclease RuvC
MRFIGIDPSTMTGFVALDERGLVTVAKVITGSGDIDPRRMVTMIDEIREHLRKSDIIAIEGFPYASMQAIQLGGIGWMLRGLLYRSGVKYQDVAPNALKARVGVTGWVGEKGSKERLKGKAKKNAVIEATERVFGRSFSNDNINDAYVLAHIARENYYKERKLHEPTF